VFRHEGIKKGTRDMHAAVFVAGLDQHLPAPRPGVGGCERAMSGWPYGIEGVWADEALSPLGKLAFSRWQSIVVLQIL
jgi:hypothetical protein